MIRVRELDADGLPEWLAVRNRISPEDPLELDQLVNRRRRDPHHRDLLAELDGVPAGVGTYGRLLDWPGSAVGRVHVEVLPDHRRRGVATALHRALSAIARAGGDEELDGQVSGPTAETGAYVAARGYRPVLRMVESRLDLGVAPARGDVREAASQAPRGVEIRSAAEDPSVLQGAYLVALESEPDIPEAREWVRPADFGEWRAREIDDEVFVPDASLVAYVDGEPAAYGLVVIKRPGLAEHFATGVARAHRNRGLATFLKRAQIERAREAGLSALVAWNEESNEPIRHVNRKLGYRITRDVVTYRGPLL